MTQNASKVPDCKVCLVPHDDDIHEATLAVKRWFAWQVTKHFNDYEPEPEAQAEMAGTAA